MKDASIPLDISRRQMMATGAAACLATQSAAASSSLPVRYTIESDRSGRQTVDAVHKGKQSIDLRRFRFAEAAMPARFITYTLPPGSSEGVHAHFADNRNGEGAFDEYYYIVSGSGQMEIDGEIVPVQQGDHIHTPLTVAHGIENTHPTLPLQVFLTFIDRAAA